MQAKWVKLVTSYRDHNSDKEKRILHRIKREIHKIDINQPIYSSIANVTRLPIEYAVNNNRSKLFRFLLDHHAKWPVPSYSYTIQTDLLRIILTHPLVNYAEIGPCLLLYEFDQQFLALQHGFKGWMKNCLDSFRISAFLKNMSVVALQIIRFRRILWNNFFLQTSAKKRVLVFLLCKTIETGWENDKTIQWSISNVVSYCSVRPKPDKKSTKTQMIRNFFMQVLQPTIL